MELKPYFYYQTYSKNNNWDEILERNISYLENKRKNSIYYTSCAIDNSLGMPIPMDIKNDYYPDILYDFKNLAFGLFQIDLENYFEIKFHMLKQLNCQFSEVEQLPYYELEMMVEKLKKWLEKEKEAREKEEKEYDKNSYKRDADSMMKKYSSPNNSSTPKYSTPKMPSSYGSAPRMPKI